MKKTGNTPLNARIKVDYCKKDVSFSYPGGSGSLYDKMLSVLSIMYFPLIVLFVSTLIVFAANNGEFKDMGNVFLNCLQSFELMLRVLFVLIVWYITAIFISAIIARSYEKYSDTFPKLQYLVSRIWLPVISITIDKLDKKEFILPVFKNVALDYELDGDFSKMIRTVEITDYPFDIHINGKTDKNLRMWKAVFRFDSIPKKGNMRLDFV